MVEKADRSRVGEAPRADDEPSSPGADREWELFVRDDGSDPLRHVGSVTAPDVATARDQSARLFAWYAEDLWLCPADAVARFSTHSLVSESGDGAASSDAADGTTVDGDSTRGECGTSDDGPSVVEEDDVVGRRDDESGDDADEPRVTEL